MIPLAPALTMLILLDPSPPPGLPGPAQDSTTQEPAATTAETAEAAATVLRVAGTELEVPAYLRAAVANEARPERDRRRDTDRLPAEVLTFYDIRPGQKVAELMCGTGYYVQILSHAVGQQGRVYAQNNEFVLKRFADEPLTALLRKPGLENVVRLDRELEEPGLPTDLDRVLMIRFYHDTYWQKVDRKKMNAAVFAALKPGGVFGVLDHHAQAGSGDRDVLSLHRVDAELVKKEVLAAGFVLEKECDLLRGPKDTRDWNIFEKQAVRRDRTDRFMFLFRKPDPSSEP